MSRTLQTSLKMGLVFVAASLLARLFGLDGWITGGLIALLSIQQTKKDSLIVAAKRLVNAGAGLALSSAFFVMFGYSFAVFALFVFIFALMSWLSRTQEGIVPTLVLSASLLAYGSFDGRMLLETSLLMVTAIGVATVSNVFFPTGARRVFMTHMDRIDSMLKDHLYVLALALKDNDGRTDYETHRTMMDKRLGEVIKAARLMDKDVLFDNDHRYLSYLEMRQNQISVADDIYTLASRIRTPHPYSQDISRFVMDLIPEIGHADRATAMRERLRDMLETYRKSPLPETRDDFETRAALFQALFELERFLDQKIRFHESYPVFP
jgi:uncharacterized membrane protein YgaE (UPF0421/DUF939 family)